ncbi:MAG: cytochrome C oxidase subunit IV family protein [Chloroflexi bacterium]|nr:cytochrome C oxidase subunit IV family protein [Chloroflexota bacterium]MBI5350267.1 cytochrome C oxidase subunit IV family protein [Chloroflexota bacterium]MBI5712055.1 cytochrome C oxidase subunit IV family protein [Chloroflexota bacterium]
MSSHSDKSALVKRSVIVTLGLGVLTALEFFAGRVPEMGAVLLVIIAVGKAALVLEYFMHVGKLFSDYSDGGH